MLCDRSYRAALSVIGLAPHIPWGAKREMKPQR